MSAELPQAIAVGDDDVVVGYCLSPSLDVERGPT